MTPKEKARELVNKYLELFGGHYQHFTVNDAKQCALIAVDEIIKAVEGKYNQYWQEVKEEIEKL